MTPAPSETGNEALDVGATGPYVGAPVLEVENVTKRYGDFTAVNDVSFSIPAGSIYGFLGPNGAGKTTTIRMILEILKPTEGSIRVFGGPSALAVRERIGYLPEEKGLYKKMKAWSIIAYFATLKGMSRRDAKAKAYELLERFGLGDFADKRTEALSKGMGQKVQVLAAIAHDPELVILDEPFSGLDPVNQQVMEEIIRDMANRGRTILFSTHVMAHAERMCNRILLIAGGKKKFDGTVQDAKRTIPRRIQIGTSDSVAPLEALPTIHTIQPYVPDDALGEEPAPGEWLVEITEDADPQSILEACFQHGIRLRRFDHSPPSLHDVFVHLVGADAREARFR